MNPLEEILDAVIRREGPIRFARFMELALYHPEHGYYRRARDPFGRAGDFFTAEQLQPVFGLLLARVISDLSERLASEEEFTVVELGAGRGEMAEAFAGWRYVPLEIGRGALPERLIGVVFANEFFDALPVEEVVRRGDLWRLLRVGRRGGRFVWVEGEAVEGEIGAYVERFVRLEEEGARAEVHLQGLAWLERIAKSLERGFLVANDYGYTGREQFRFPQGSLMSYRRHRALQDVLAEPGERDITSHVPFTALIEHGARCGLRTVRLERLGRVLLEAGRRDALAAALQAPDAAAQTMRRLQLKTLLFGLGESFRVLIQQRGEEATGGKKEKGPESVGA